MLNWMLPWLGSGWDFTGLVLRDPDLSPKVVRYLCICKAGGCGWLNNGEPL